MPRSNIYTDELANKIFEYIAEYGTHRDGFERAGISRNLFYNWLKEKKNFNDGVCKALAEFKSAKADRKIQARKTLDDYLFGRAKRVTKINKKVTNVYYTDEGEEKENITIEEQTKVTTELCPEWVISRVLGKNLDEMEALQILLEKGLLPESIFNEAVSNWDEFKIKLKDAFDNLGNS